MAVLWGGTQVGPTVVREAAVTASFRGTKPATMATSSRTMVVATTVGPQPVAMAFVAPIFKIPRPRAMRPVTMATGTTEMPVPSSAWRPVAAMVIFGLGSKPAMMAMMSTMTVVVMPVLRPAAVMGSSRRTKVVMMAIGTN
tara:strand:+ start:397 stop:819 length:423 start_codon:yes stop_codon:yes gene_type:complete